MQFLAQRKGPRIHISVPVRLQGRANGGAPFDVKAWTLNISHSGACIHVPENVEVPPRLHIKSDDYQFLADADVDVVWERTVPQRAIGVKVRPGSRATVWNVR
jgi:hypothetical protein